MRDSNELQSMNIRLWSSELEKIDTKKSKTKTLKNISLENKDQLDKELKQIESDWKSKFSLNQTEKSIEQITSNPKRKETVAIQQSNPIQDLKITNLSQAVTEQFKKSIDIHKKPTELLKLKEIFEFKFVKSLDELTNEKSDTLIEIDENSLKQLLFVEYVLQRLMDLFTKKTKNFILERELEDLAKLNQERERDEYLKKCDEYVLKNNILFSDLTNDSDMGSLKINQKVVENDDNGEAEMLAKLQVFMDKDELNKLSGVVSSNPNDQDFNVNDFRKKPLPNYKLLKEESLKNQLKVREFFMGATASKTPNEENVEEIDYNQDSNVFNQNLIFKLRNSTEEIARILPTVDNQSQIEIRRNIFYEKLVKK
jgi:hypothetical protein